MLFPHFEKSFRVVTKDAELVAVLLLEEVQQTFKSLRRPVGISDRLVEGILGLRMAHVALIGRARIVPAVFVDRRGIFLDRAHVAATALV